MKPRPFIQSGGESEQFSTHLGRCDGPSLTVRTDPCLLARPPVVTHVATVSQVLKEAGGCRATCGCVCIHVHAHTFVRVYWRVFRVYTCVVWGPHSVSVRPNVPTVGPHSCDSGPQSPSGRRVLLYEGSPRARVRLCPCVFEVPTRDVCGWWVPTAPVRGCPRGT